MIKLQDPITIKQAADMKRISPQLMRYYMDRQYTPEPIKVAGHYYFERDDIKGWDLPEPKKGRPSNATAG